VYHQKTKRLDLNEKENLDNLGAGDTGLSGISTVPTDDRRLAQQ
jgi:hypothetical protein